MLRAIVGVQKVNSGEITVLGLPAGNSALRRRVAYVTEAPSVYVDVTVAENLQLSRASCKRHANVSVR